MASPHSIDGSPESQPVYIKQEEDGFSLINPTQSKTERPPLSLPGEIAFILIVCSAQLMTQARLGQAIAPLHIIAASFGVDNDPAQLSWFPAAYSLTVGTFILIADRLGDLYSHNRLFVAGYFWFSLCSVLAGFTVLSIMAPYFSIAVELFRVLVLRSYYRMGLRFSGQHIRLV
jgi:MFS family permease